MRSYTFRPHADRPRLVKRILKLTKDDPSLSPDDIAQLTGSSHVTVRKVQRAAGVYKPRGAAGRTLDVEPCFCKPNPLECGPDCGCYGCGCTGQRAKDLKK